jgi:hypothetical protein
MRHLVLLAIAILYHQALYAQGGFKRKYILQKSATAINQNAIEAPDGAFLAIGFSTDTVNAKLITYLTLIGTDPNGNFLWRKKYGNENVSYINDLSAGAVLTESDCFYHALSMRDTSENGVLLKFNYSGDTLWQKVFRRDSVEWVHIYGICKSVDGGLLLTGEFVDYKNNIQSCLLIKTDINGKELWRRKIIKPSPPSVQAGKGITQDSATKKIIIVGYQYIGTATSGDTYSNILILDSLGNQLIQQTFNNADGGGFGGIIQLRDKHFVTGGSWATGFNRWVSNAVKFDLNGAIIWQKFFDLPSIYNSIAPSCELSNGDIMLFGWLDTMQRPPFWYPLLISARVTRIDYSGKLIWARNVGNAYVDSISEGPYCLNPTKDKGFIIAAMNPYLSGRHRFSLIKIDSNACDTTPEVCQARWTVGIEEQPKSAGFRIYPNPAGDKLFIEPEGGGTSSPLIITDVAGREVRRLEIDQEKSEHDISAIPAGVYFVRSVQHTGIPVKLVIMR